MKVLVATGSKYGSTREVGQVIGDELATLGFDVDIRDACDVLGVHFYDAVVVGSAVYGGLWRRDASDLIRDHILALRTRDVFMFSVGMETVVRPGQRLDEAEQLASSVKAIEHARFAGKLAWNKLNVGERAFIRALRVPQGDFRDFYAVRGWAQDVGHALHIMAST